VGSTLGGVGFEVPVHAEALAGGAEERQKDDRKSVQQQKPVTSARVGDAKGTHPHAEAQVLGVTETGFDMPYEIPLIKYL
jgi:hypothetical protein